MNRNPFATMRDAKPSGGGNYLPIDFQGEVQIMQCYMNAGFKQDLAFIADFTILTSNLPDIQPGMSKTWYQGKLEDPQMSQTAVGEVGGFIAAALGVNVQDPDVRDAIGMRVLTITGPTNPLAGMRLLVETWNKPNKRTGAPFTKHRFTAVEGAPGHIPANIEPFVEAPQGYAPPQQGYAPPQQGYRPAPAPYAPPPQATQFNPNFSTHAPGYAAPPPQAPYAPPPARAPYAPPPQAPPQQQYAPPQQQAKPVWDAATGQWRMP